jgi:DnaJ homolog subfamily C member 13
MCLSLSFYRIAVVNINNQPQKNKIKLWIKYTLKQAANNLAKSSVIACVALAGYTVTFKADEKEIDEPEKKEPKEIKGKVESTTTITSSTTTTPITTIKEGEGGSTSYTSNASNILQNNSSLIAQVNNNSANVKEPASPGEDASENAKLVKSYSKYTMTGEPQNIVAKSMLDILLTPFIADKLAVDAESEVLKVLTQNTRNPYLIWDNGTRAQLLDFLEFQRQNSSKHQHDDITDIYNTTSKFVYDATRDELKIGGVYIRIYNEMPTFPIQNAKKFVLDLLEYLKQAYIFINGSRNHNNNGTNQKISEPMSPQRTKSGQMQAPLIPTPVKPTTATNQKNLDNILNDYNRSKMRNQLEKRDNDTEKISYDFASDQKFVEHLIMTLNSLISVMKQNPNVELQCIGNFDVLFGLLNVNLQCENENVSYSFYLIFL